MILRDYQKEAIVAIYEYLRTENGNPCCVLPTGSGKTPVLASICHDAVVQWHGRVLILAHVKELLEQAKGKLSIFCPDLPIGLYSAGLGERTSDGPIIVAGIQSVYRRAAELGRFDLIIVDECFTGDTMISTPTGNVPIANLRVGQYVYNALGIGKVECISARPTRNLVKVLFDNGTSTTCTPNHRFFTQNGWVEAEKLAAGTHLLSPEDMRMLRENILPVGEKECEGGNNLLRKRGKLEPSEVLFHLLLEDQRECYEFAGMCGQSIENSQTNETPPSATRGQWTFIESSKNSLNQSWDRLERRVCGDDNQEPEIGRCAQTLQNRCCKYHKNDCHRVGRKQSFASITNERGYKENTSFGSVRVASVENVQCDSDTVVYNLQIGGSPTYFAGGVLVHNCHLLPDDGDGMYRQFLAEMKEINPQVRLVGLTATPYRMTSGMLCGPENLLHDVCYEVGVKELIAQGYLCPLITKGSRHKEDYSKLHVRAGEFIASEVDEIINTKTKVYSVCNEIMEQTRDRHRVLIFAGSVEHAKNIQKTLSKMTGQECGLITGTTPSAERDTLLRRFKGEQVTSNLFNDALPDLKFMVNVNVLTTGFDAPNIDCIALVRPTASPGLYYQMVGRGLRLDESKTDCLVLDFGGNILRHGPIDAMRITAKGSGDGEAPAKECPECNLIMHAAYAICPGCGYVFPVRETSELENEASQENIISCDEVEEFPVEAVSYAVHTKAGADETAPKTMRVDYRIGWNRFKSEWLCVEHEGWPRKKFEHWWTARTKAPLPSSAYEAVLIANSGALAKTEKITVTKKAGERYDRVTDYVLGEIPSEVPESLPEHRCAECTYYADRWCSVFNQYDKPSESPACVQFLSVEEIPF